MRTGSHRALHGGCNDATANKVVVGVGATERTSVLSPLFHLLPSLTSLNVSGACIQRVAARWSATSHVARVTPGNVVGDDGLRALGHSLIQATQLLSLNVNGEHRLLQLPCCGSCPAMLRFDKCGSWSVDRLFHRDTRSAGADRAAARHPKPAGTVHHRSAVLCLVAL